MNDLRSRAELPQYLENAPPLRDDGDDQLADAIEAEDRERWEEEHADSR